jgi:hypothetical protein
LVDYEIEFQAMFELAEAKKSNNKGNSANINVHTERRHEETKLFNNDNLRRSMNDSSDGIKKGILHKTSFLLLSKLFVS